MSKATKCSAECEPEQQDCRDKGVYMVSEAIADQQHTQYIVQHHASTWWQYKTKQRPVRASDSLGVTKQLT